MVALNPLFAGAALKLEASKTAEIDNRAIERATWSAQARVELFRCFFIELFRLNQFYVAPSFPAEHCRVRLAKSENLSERLGDVPGAAALASGELMDVRAEAAQAERGNCGSLSSWGGEDCPIVVGCKI